MNQLYQRTFDHVTMPEDHVRSLRATLASRCSNTETEVNSMNAHKKLRRPGALLVAVILALSLSITAFAAGSYVVYQIHTGEIKLPEDSFIYDLIEVKTLPYENWTESNGEVTVTFDADDWNNIE